MKYFIVLVLLLSCSMAWGEPQLLTPAMCQRNIRTWGICPECKKPTRIKQGASFQTSAYYPPIYNEYGENINPDMNTTKTTFTCQECGLSWTE